VPDIEHTLLQPLSVLALYHTYHLLDFPLQGTVFWVFRLSGILFAALPMGFILKSKHKSQELAPMLVIVQIVALHVLFSLKI
jgi:hypothetical protein